MEAATLGGRDGACASLLQMHLLKCFGVALAVALLPFIYCTQKEHWRADTVQGRCDPGIEYGPR